MVSQTQMSNEFYDYDLPKTESEDDDLTLLFLATLAKFYDKYMARPPSYVLKHIDEDAKQLENDLKDIFNSNNFINAIFLKVMDRDGITEIEKVTDLNIDNEVKLTKEVVIATIVAAVDQLRCDLIIKARVWEDMHKLAEEFDIKVNYLRTVKRMRDAGRYYNTMVSQKIERESLKTVYGKKVEAIWVCYGKNPCDWCLSQQSMPPRPIDEWEFDHIGGFCGLKVVE